MCVECIHCAQDKESSDCIKGRQFCEYLVLVLRKDVVLLGRIAS
jgi:hypothetical protein